MTQIIDRIYSSGCVTGRTGTVHQLHSAIDPAEGQFLYALVSKDDSIVSTLEVGCAYGLSSLHICHALSGRPSATHTIIDPKQMSVWDGAGVRNLEEAGFHFAKLIEEPSEIALPKLLEQGTVYDMAFVDGWHTFDHTLLDCFYATRLLRVGGYLVLDDVEWRSVRRVASYMTHYPCFTTHSTLDSTQRASWKRQALRHALSIVPREWRASIFRPSLLQDGIDSGSVRMLALQKMADDQRRWDWFPTAW
jgi:predicted O-methyltransferase YrrM